MLELFLISLKYKRSKLVELLFRYISYKMEQDHEISKKQRKLLII